MKVIYESTDVHDQTLLVWQSQEGGINILISHLAGGRTWHFNKEQAEDFLRKLNNKGEHNDGN